MPTARELLEQADALMRRNRAAAAVEPVPPAQVPAPVSPAYVPALAEHDLALPEHDFALPEHEVASPEHDRALPEQPESPHVPQPTAIPEHDPVAVPPPAPQPAVVEEAITLSLDDIPLLTDAVEEIEVQSIAASIPDEGEPSAWPEHGHETPSIFGDVPDSMAIVPPAKVEAQEEVVVTEAAMDEEMAADDVALTESMHLQGSVLDVVPNPAADLPRGYAPVEVPPAPMVPPSMARMDDDARWQAMAEEIRMQVLQRIDLFTDAGLHKQLGARLQPIVDRASADLVASINQHVGELLRSYVAEAIEREIERWRADR